MLSLLLADKSQAHFRMCNETIDTIYGALAYEEESTWRLNGYTEIPSGSCKIISDEPMAEKEIYAFAVSNRVENGRIVRNLWDDKNSIVKFCMDQVSANSTEVPCEGELNYFLKLGNFPDKDVDYILKNPERALPAVRTGVVQERCIASWDDSHQLHSSEIVLRWNYQKFRFTFKKLSHCLKVTITGPVDIEGVAESYVDQCVDYALNDKLFEHVLKLGAAVVTDVFSVGSTGGAAISAAVADYMAAVVDRAVSCFSDTDKLGAHVQAAIAEKFDSVVTQEAEWIYWDL
jgi:hypothetical protein